MPKVTVLMPVYNGEKYLNEAVNSMLTQTFTDFEFLIIDDGSIDKTIDIIRNYQDSRIRLIQNPCNFGLVATLNLGISLSNGEYIARMDADDISFPERLEKQVSFLDTHPEITLLGTNAQIINNHGDLQSISKTPSGDIMIKWQMCFNCPLIHPTVMMRKKNVDMVDGYSCDEIKDRERYSGEDYNLWRKISNRFKVNNLNDILLYLRKHETNITTTYLEEHIKNASIINNLVIRKYVNAGIEKSRRIFTNQYQSKQEMFESTLLIFRMYQKFIKKHDPKPSIKKEISKDAYTRIWNLMLNYYKHDLKFSLLIFLLIYLCPLIFFRQTCNKIIRLFYIK